MTFAQIQSIFASELGQQLDKVFITPDDQPFIRYREAKSHCEQHNLPVDAIATYYEEDYLA